MSNENCSKIAREFRVFCAATNSARPRGVFLAIVFPHFLMTSSFTNSRSQSLGYSCAQTARRMSVPMWQPRVAHWDRVRFSSDWQSDPATLVSNLEALGSRLQQHTLHAQNDSPTSSAHRFFVDEPWEIDCNLREQARLAWRENTGAAKKRVREGRSK